MTSLHFVFFFNQTMKSASCLLLLVFFVALSYADFLGCAGSVSSQVNYKTSVPSLEVSWSGFANEERVIRYDLAVITEDSAPRGFSSMYTLPLFFPLFFSLFYQVVINLLFFFFIFLFFIFF